MEKTIAVTVLGGSGFVGRHVVQELFKRDHAVRVLTRRRDHARALFVLPEIEVVQCDVHDPNALAAALDGSDAVINLAGVLHDSRRSGFQRVHVELVRSIAAACERHRISRVLHVSALHAGREAPSAYLRSKGEAEEILRSLGERGVDVTLFRPSVIFGPDDNFINLFAKLVRLLPVIALACPNTRFQPIYVGDVARILATSLTSTQTHGQSYDLCGPKIYSLRELVEFVAALLGKRRPIIGLSKGLSLLQAWLMEFSPVKLLTRDNIRSMQVDSVCQCEFPREFGFAPTTLESVMVDHLTGGSVRARYQLFRNRAGRSSALRN